MRPLNPDELGAINKHIETAYRLAELKAQAAFGKKNGLKQIAFIDREYHREMDRHAVALGLRVPKQ